MMLPPPADCSHRRRLAPPCKRKLRCRTFSATQKHTFGHLRQRPTGISWMTPGLIKAYCPLYTLHHQREPQIVRYLIQPEDVLKQPVILPTPKSPKEQLRCHGPNLPARMHDDDKAQI